MNDYNGMVDYNGWIKIHMHYDDDDVVFNGSDLKRFLEEMEPLESSFNNIFNRFIEYIPVNGMSGYHIYGAHNHNLNYFDDLMELYKTIGKKAPGSFGLLYVRLPEHPVYWNQYRVFRLANGILTGHEDTLLSPCRPIIEP